MNEAVSLDAPAPAPAMSSTRSPALDRTDWAWLGALLLAFLVTRGVVFPFAENLYGDAVARAEIAERWAKSPTLYRSYQDGVYQFGPFHMYWMGTLLELWPSREHATRLASLIAALLMIVPVYRLGRRLFSREAAVVAGLCIGFWGLHIQASTTAASEALFLTLFFFALDYLFAGLDEQRVGPLFVSAAFVNLACATRYDGWLYLPLLVLTVVLWGKDRVAGITRATIYGALCSVFPLWWMHQSELASGDPLYVVHYVERYHASWVHSGLAWLGPLKHRMFAGFFFPGTLLLAVGVPVGLFAMAGMARAFVERRRRALAVLALVPVAYYAFRGAVLVDFMPLARFNMAQVALALFYVKDGFDWTCGRLGRRVQLAAAAITAATAIGWTVWLGLFTAGKAGVWEENLRPISPVSTIPADQMAAARYVRENIRAHEMLLVDEEPQFLDMNVAFFTGLPETRMARRRWENFEAQLCVNQNARWMVAARDGKLLADAGAAFGAPTVQWRGRTWEKRAQLSERLAIYRRP